MPKAPTEEISRPRADAQAAGSGAADSISADRKLAQDARFFLASIVESSEESIVTVDFDNVITTWNKAAEKLYGYPAAETIGRPLTMVTLPEDLNQVLRNIDKIKHGKEVVRFETVRMHKQGQLIDLEIVLSPVKNDAGEVIGVSTMARDITQRKQAEEALRESEARLSAIFAEAGVGLSEVSRDGRFQRVNPTLCRILGRSCDELLTLTVADVTLPKDMPASVEALQRLAETGEPVSLDKRYVRPDGTIVWANSTVSLLPGGEGGEARFLIVTSDLTERRRAEQVIRESEERLRKAISIETVGVLFFNLEGEITDANQAFERMSGYSHDAIANGKPRWDDLTPPEFMEASRKALQELTTTGRSTPYEKQYIRPDGSRWWGLFAATRVGENEFVEFVLDITEAKHSQAALRATEERTRLLMQSVEDVAIFTTDTDGIITAWNPGAEKIFGFKADEIIGKQSADIVFTPEDIEKGEPEKERREARENGKALDERWHIRKNGDRFFASGFMVPLTDGTKLIGYGKIASDLTERKRHEDELRQAREQLERRVAERTAELAETNATLRQQMMDRKRAQAERVHLLRQIVTTQEDERRRIARDLHDQMGQRLTALRLQMASLREQCKDDEICRGIERLQELGEQIDAEVNFLAWELRPTALDDLGLVTAVENFVREWSNHFGIPAEFHSTGLKNKRFESEIETNLYRISQEALNNVFKHSHATEVNVLLELRRDEVVLIVEDNGTGFDVERQRLNRRHGSAMGLLGMHERAAIVGGTVEIESAPDKGTTLFARIPARFAGKDEKLEE